MSTSPAGNTEALRSYRDATHAKTRQELELALARLRNGNPRRVKKGIRVTPMSVAQEAGIDRSTLYRFHEPVLSQIRKLNEKEPRQQLQTKRTELSEVLTRVKEYRVMLENYQGEMKAWARQNYALSHRVRELEDLLRIRDGVIAQLKQQASISPKVVRIQKKEDQ